MADTGHRESGADDPLSQEFDEKFAAAARFQEPSAAERARRPGRLARPKTTRQARRQRPAPQRRPHQRARTLVTFALFAGVLAAAGWVLSMDLTHPAPALPQAQGASPAASHPAAPQPPFSLADPFAGSPARNFAGGTAGIVPPAPHTVGPYSRAQVGRAYAMVKKMLIAAHLSARTMAAGPPDAFARLLPPAERRIFLKHLGDKGLSSQGSLRSTRAWVTSFAPGDVHLATPVVKVHGTMAARVARSKGQDMLRVKADYLFVYAVERSYDPLTRMRIVFRDVVRVDFAQWDDPGGPLEPWWSPLGGGAAGSSCDATDGFIHPTYPGSVPGKVRPSGKPVDPYDQSRLPGGHGCQPTTGT
jgi:hypothetical protein